MRYSPVNTETLLSFQRRLSHGKRKNRKEKLIARMSSTTRPGRIYFDATQRARKSESLRVSFEEMVPRDGLEPSTN
jgi:hypothetical protein